MVQAVPQMTGHQMTGSDSSLQLKLGYSHGHWYVLMSGSCCHNGGRGQEMGFMATIPYSHAMSHPLARSTPANLAPYPALMHTLEWSRSLGLSD